MMWHRKRRNIFIFIAKAVLIALLVVMLIRGFFVESFSVTSLQMQASLLKGDKVFVNKTSYGIRMPVTLLSIPFTFDRFMGFKSYSSAIKFPYQRVFNNVVERNDVVLYNNPGELGKPLDKRNLLLNRCIGLPGDTISAVGNRYIINHKEYTSSPDMMQLYRFNTAYVDTIGILARELDIHLYNAGRFDEHSLMLFLSKFDAYLINRNVSDSFDVLTEALNDLFYDFVVPHKGMTIELTHDNLTKYGQAILAEMENRAGIIEGKLMIDYKEQTSYTFADDYYWMICDNTINSVDSRTIGFVPRKSIIGQASFVWFSKGERGIRWDRSFSKVK